MSCLWSLANCSELFFPESQMILNRKQTMQLRTQLIRAALSFHIEVGSAYFALEGNMNKGCSESNNAYYFNLLAADVRGGCW